MRIALDVLGGDHAPDANLQGAQDALPSLADDDRLLLVGDQSTIEEALRTRGVNDRRLEIVHAPDVIGMDESPVEAVRTKPDSSIVRMAQLAHRNAENPVDVIISAGNTGACVSAAQMFMRRLPGVHRPGIAVVLPTVRGPVVVIDVGANPDPRASHLWQYGLMGEAYARLNLGIEHPRIAAMNIGGEEGKGTDFVKSVRDMFKATPGINYVGFVEGRDIFDHKTDVVVTDGFVGNVIIKLSEGLASGLFQMIGKEIAAFDPEMARKFQPVVKGIYSKLDYHEQGGAPLLGVNGICVICHGSSEARTITNAILKSRSMVSKGLNAAISQRLAEVQEVAGNA